MAAARTRYRESGFLDGSWDHGGGNVVDYNVSEHYDDVCKDVVGKRDRDNPFDSTQYEREGGYMLGNSCKVPISFAYLSPSMYTGAPSSSSYVSRIMAQTGPLTPKLYLPTSIFEMRDIPAMLLHAGNLLHGIRISDRFLRTGHGLRLSPVKEAAAATLAYQFGWAPLIQDISRMVHLAENVKRVQKTLLRAHTEKGIRRKINLFSDEKVTTGRSTVHSTWGVLMGANYTNVASIKQWATIRWKVRDQSQIGYMPTFSEAFKVAYGLNPGYIPIEIWKAMPWSWAIDWFTDISNRLQASHNMIYYKPSNLNIMTHYVTERTYMPGKASGGAPYSFTGAVTKVQRRYRTQQAPVNSISLRLPFLDSFKLSILGSMTILRLSR